MATSCDITPDLCRQLIDYDALTGKLTWRARPVSVFAGGQKRSAEMEARVWNGKYAGTEAFTARHSNGYRKGDIFKRRLYAHRVIWAVVTGRWPSGEVDHINGDPGDNRWDNLRDVSHTTNGRNTKRHATNSSGHVGVHFDRQRERWVAQITLDGKRIPLGRYESKEAAIAARVKAQAGREFSADHGRRD